MMYVQYTKLSSVPEGGYPKDESNTFAVAYIPVSKLVEFNTM